MGRTWECELQRKVDAIAGCEGLGRVIALQGIWTCEDFGSLPDDRFAVMLELISWQRPNHFEDFEDDTRWGVGHRWHLEQLRVVCQEKCKRVEASSHQQQLQPSAIAVSGSRSSTDSCDVAGKDPWFVHVPRASRAQTREAKSNNLRLVAETDAEAVACAAQPASAAVDRIFLVPCDESFAECSRAAKLDALRLVSGALQLAYSHDASLQVVMRTGTIQMLVYMLEHAMAFLDTPASSLAQSEEALACAEYVVSTMLHPEGYKQEYKQERSPFVAARNKCRDVCVWRCQVLGGINFLTCRDNFLAEISYAAHSALDSIRAQVQDDAAAARTAAPGLTATTIWQRHGFNSLIMRVLQEAVLHKDSHKTNNWESQHMHSHGLSIAKYFKTFDSNKCSTNARRRRTKAAATARSMSEPDSWEEGASREHSMGNAAKGRGRSTDTMLIAACGRGRSATHRSPSCHGAIGSLSTQMEIQGSVLLTNAPIEFGGFRNSWQRPASVPAPGRLLSQTPGLLRPMHGVSSSVRVLASDVGIQTEPDLLTPFQVISSSASVTSSDASTQTDSV